MVLRQATMLAHMQPRGLAGRSIIVSGAGSGIGAATARLLAQAGCLVTVADISRKGAAETTAAIMAADGRAHMVEVDITDEASVVAMVDAAVSTFGRLDGACNAVGIPQSNRLLHEVTLEDFRKRIDVNLVGAFLCLKHEIVAMKRTGGGALVILGSTASVKGFSHGAEYCASKAGLLGLLRVAAAENAAEGIRVNAVLPGGTRTPMLDRAFAGAEFLEDYFMKLHPMGRFAEPDEIGYAVRWLLSDEASFVTGAALAADGGQTAI